MQNEKAFYVIAHRGASAYYPENTMSSFRAAVEMDADMIELDVQLSKDKQIVVFHDAVLQRKTNGKGLLIEKTYSELNKLDAGSWFRKEFKDERIPLLSEVLMFTRNKILVNIEIKTEAVTENAEGGITQLVLGLIKKLNVEDQVIISSFDYRVFQRLEKFGSKVKRAILYEKKTSGRKSPAELVAEYKVDAFNCSAREIKSKWILELNRENIPFFVYTVNNTKSMKKLIEAGAKGLFSDKPDLLKEVLEGKK